MSWVALTISALGHEATKVMMLHRRHACADAGLRHLRTRPYTPRTNGKAERVIQTALRESAYARPYASSSERSRAIDPWLHHYNHHRPHAGINAATPAARLNNLLGNES